MHSMTCSNLPRGVIWYILLRFCYSGCQIRQCPPFLQQCLDLLHGQQDTKKPLSWLPRTGVLPAACAASLRTHLARSVRDLISLVVTELQVCASACTNTPHIYRAPIHRQEFLCLPASVMSFQSGCHTVCKPAIQERPAQQSDRPWASWGGAHQRQFCWSSKEYTPCACMHLYMAGMALQVGF